MEKPYMVIGRRHPNWGEWHDDPEASDFYVKKFVTMQEARQCARLWTRQPGEVQPAYIGAVVTSLETGASVAYITPGCEELIQHPTTALIEVAVRHADA